MSTTTSFPFSRKFTWKGTASCMGQEQSGEAPGWLPHLRPSPCTHVQLRQGLGPAVIGQVRPIAEIGLQLPFVLLVLLLLLLSLLLTVGVLGYLPDRPRLNPTGPGPGHTATEQYRPGPCPVHGPLGARGKTCSDLCLRGAQTARPCDSWGTVTVRDGPMGPTQLAVQAKGLRKKAQHRTGHEVAISRAVLK